MEIRPDRNSLITGPTRCGKTQFMRWMLSGCGEGEYPHQLIVDQKREWKPRKRYGDALAKDLHQLARELNAARANGRRVIYQPPKEHLLRANSAYLDEVAYMALERKKTLLYYDDVIIVANGSDFQSRAPNFYYCLTLGNGQGVGVWMCAQRPKWIPVSVLSDSSFYGTFYLRRKGDRETMEDLLGENLDQPMSVDAWNVLRRNRYTFVFGDDFATSKPTRLDPALVNAQLRAA